MVELSYQYKCSCIYKSTTIDSLIRIREEIMIFTITYFLQKLILYLELYVTVFRTIFILPKIHA